MSSQYQGNKEEASALGGAPGPQDGQRTGVNASRLVIRDKSSAEPHQTYTGRTFPIVDTERATLQMGRRKNSVELVFHPIPDKSASRTNAHVDWLGLTVTPPEGKPIQWVFHELQNAFGLSVTKIRNVGWNGYLHRADVGRFGLVAWGGKAQRGTVHIEINGMGCAHIEEWGKIEAWRNQYRARITRIDLAHDDLEGKYSKIKCTLEWHDANVFNCGGRNARVFRDGEAER